MGINKNLFCPADFRKRGRTPLHTLLEEKLRNLIEEGHWKANECIPSERDLAEMSGISVSTIKKALQSLVIDGYLQRRQGSGTFVSSPENFFGVHRYYGMQKDFSEAHLARHRKIVLGLDLVELPEHIAFPLKLEEGEKAYRLERVLLTDGVKSIHTFSWLPKKYFPDLNAIPDEQFLSMPLYEILSIRFNMPCRVSQELFSVKKADGYLAERLEIEEGTPFLSSSIISFSYRSIPFEYRESSILTDKLKLRREF